MSKNSFTSLQRVLSLAMICIMILSLSPAVFANGETHTVSGKISGLSNCENLIVYYFLNNSDASNEVTTAANGIYTISNIPHGAKIEIHPETKFGWSLAPVGQTIGSVDSDTVGINFAYVENGINTQLVSGTLSGLPNYNGLYMTYSGIVQGSVPISTDGKYMIPNVPVGEIAFTPPTVTGYNWEGPEGTTVGASPVAGMNFVYTIKKYSITGTIGGVNDTVVVKYTIDGGDLIDINAVGGSYTITNIPHGANVVIYSTPIQGYDVNVETITFNSLAANETARPIQYTESLVETFYVSGRVLGLIDVGNISVDYKINNEQTKTVMTDQNGIYTIANIPDNASLTITPRAKTGYTFAPLIIELTNVIESSTDNNITYTRENYTISGTVTGLTNNAGVQLAYQIDANSSQTVTTGMSGTFTIRNVPYESMVVITPTPQGYYTADAKTFSNVKNNVSGVLIEYDADEFSVTYKANGGAGSDISALHKAGSIVKVGANTFTAPEKRQFAAWNTEEVGGGTSYQPGAVLTMGDKNIILYAIWEEIPSGNTSGGSGGGGGSSSTANESNKPTPNDSELKVIAVSDTGVKLYETNTTETSGSMITVTAPRILGHVLLGENTRQIKINKGQNTVTFSYRKEVTPVLENMKHIKYINGYPDGTARPDMGITRAEAAAIFFRLVSDDQKDNVISSQFSDVDNSAWYAQAVNYLAKYGVISGYQDGTFKPGNPITRAEFTAIASKFDLVEYADTSMFRDVNEKHWAYKYINSAAMKGWVTGFEYDEFKPNDGVTRVQVVTIINRMLSRSIHTDNEPINAPTYVDMPTSYWGYNDMIEASIDH